jgi:hypothetical protein
VLDDPCELNNLASRKPAILNEMLNYLNFQNQSYISLEDLPVMDPQAEPSLNCGLWGPWLDGADIDNSNSTDNFRNP